MCIQLLAQGHTVSESVVGRHNVIDGTLLVREAPRLDLAGRVGLYAESVLWRKPLVFFWAGLSRCPLRQAKYQCDGGKKHF